MTNSKLGRFLFKNTTTSQTIAKNTFWLSFGEVVGRLLRVIIIFFAARILGTAGWGTLSYMTSLAAIFTVFSDIGLSNVLIREASKDRKQQPAYFATSLLLKLGLIIFSLLLILFGTKYITAIPISSTLIYAIGTLFVFDSLRRFASSIFRAEEKMEIEAFINIATQAIIVIAGFIVLFKVPSPENLAIAYAIGAGIGFIITISLLRGHIKGLFKSFEKSLIKPIISAAWPMTLSSIFGVLLINTDSIMIGWFLDAAHVGLYAAGQRLIAFLYLLPAFIVGGLFPALSKLSENNIEGFRKIFERGLSTTILIAYPLAIGIFLTAQEIIGIFYGSEYFGAHLPLQVLALTILMTFPITVIIQAIFAFNRQKEIVPIWVFGALANVILNFYLIPTFGIVGAAWASFVTQFVTGFFVWRKMKNIIHFNVKKEILGIAKGTIIMAMVIIIMNSLNINFLIILPLSILIYFTSLKLLKDRTLNQLLGIFKAHY